MPLPSDAARVSLLAESSEDEASSNEISAPPVPGRMANPLAHAPDAELDALVRALRSKKPSDRKRLEAEEREAARARVRVELMSHVHRPKRDGVVAFPAGFDADAKARAEARRARVGGEGTEQTRTDDTPRAARARREPRETGTVSAAAAAAAADPPRDDATSRDASDADARSDASPIMFVFREMYLEMFRDSETYLASATLSHYLSARVPGESFAIPVHTFKELATDVTAGLPGAK